VTDVSHTSHFLNLQTLKTLWGLELSTCSAVLLGYPISLLQFYSKGELIWRFYVTVKN